MSTVCTGGAMPDLNAAEFESIKPMLKPLKVATGAALTCLHFSPKGTSTATGADWDHALFTDQLKTKLDGITDATTKVYLLLLSKGTYKPTTGTDRMASFVMKNHTAIIGGWNNNYVYDVKANTSLLSGDIGVANEKSDNAYHIVFNNSNKLKATTLYGVTLSYGNANGTGEHSKGGAMYNDNHVSPNIIQSTFTDNTATEGGAISNYYCEPNIIQSTFSNNTATTNGGAICNDYYGNAKIIQSTFNNNTATEGGAISNGGSHIVVSQSTFSGNKATSFGGAISNTSSSSKIFQSTFSGNTANKGGAIHKDNSSGSNASFVSLSNTIFWDNSLTGTGGSGSQIYLNTIGSVKEKLTLNSIVLKSGIAGIGFDPSHPESKQINSDNIITTNPNLGVLADNGGAVQTLAIPSGSNAINQGEYIKIKNDYFAIYYSKDKSAWFGDPHLATSATPSADSFDLTTDARGYTFSGKPDIGAYEYGGTAQ